MVFMFSHLIAAWVLGKGLEVGGKFKLGKLNWIVLLIAGILPDIDLLMQWVFGYGWHRQFTHSLSFAVFIGALLFVIFYRYEPIKQSLLGIGGVIVHLIMDSLSMPGTPLLWPLQTYFSLNYIGPIEIYAYNLFPQSVAQAVNTVKAAIFDMALGAAWIFYLIAKGKIEP